MPRYKVAAVERPHNAVGMTNYDSSLGGNGIIVKSFYSDDFANESHNDWKGYYHEDC